MHARHQKWIVAIQDRNPWQNQSDVHLTPWTLQISTNAALSEKHKKHVPVHNGHYSVNGELTTSPRVLWIRSSPSTSVEKHLHHKTNCTGTINKCWNVINTGKTLPLWILYQLVESLHSACQTWNMDWSALHHSWTIILFATNFDGWYRTLDAYSNGRAASWRKTSLPILADWARLNSMSSKQYKTDSCHHQYLALLKPDEF